MSKTIAVTDNHIYWPGGPAGGSTGNGLAWSIDGSGVAASTGAPNYFRFALDCHGGGETVTLGFASNTANTYLKVLVYNTFLGTSLAPVIAGIQGTTSLVCATGLSNSTYEFQVEAIQSDTKEWSNAASGQMLSVTGITVLNVGTNTVDISAQTLPNLMLVYGDSRTAGSKILAPATTPGDDWSESSARAIGRALNCEVAGAAFPGMGYYVPVLVGGTTYAPGLYAPSTPSWNLLFSGQSRVFPANLTHVLVYGLGVNDALRNNPSVVSVAQYTTAVSGFLPALRAAIPKKCIILVVPTWAGVNTIAGGNLNNANLVSIVQAQVAAYIASSNDPLCFLINTGLDLQEGTWAYSSTGSATYWCSEGLHPLLVGHQQIGHNTLQQIQAALQPAGPSVTWQGGHAA